MKILRIFAVWVVFVFAAAVLFLGFEFVNKTVSQSGFSSGKVFEFGEDEGILEGEIFGRKFSADISPAVRWLPFADNLILLLPPHTQLFLRGAILFYSELSSV